MYEFGRYKALDLLEDELPPAHFTTLTTHTQFLPLQAGSGPCSSNCQQIKPGTNDEWRYTQQPQIFWSQNCAEDGYFRHTLKQRRNPVDDIVYLQWMLMIFAILNTIANLILACMFGANYVLEVDLPCFPGDGHEEFEYMEKFRKYEGMVCKGIMLPFTCAAYIAATGVDSFFQTVKEKSCSDPSTNGTIVQLAASLQEVVSKNQTAMIMTIGIFVVEVLIWIKSVMIAKKHQKEVDEGKKSSVIPEGETAAEEKLR